MLMTLYLPILGRFGRLSQTSYVEKQQRDNEICIIYNKGLAQPSEPSELFLFISGFTPLRRTCHVSSYLRRTARRPLFLPVLQGCGAHTYGLPPRIPCGPSSTKSTSRCFVLPPKPPEAGGCTPRLEPKKKLFIQLQSAILPHPAPSYAVRCLLQAVLIQLPSQILLCQARYGWRLLPPQRASAAFALRSPGKQGYASRPAKPYGELHANPAQALYYSGRPLIREDHASMSHHLPGRAPFGGLVGLPSGGRSLRPHPAAVSPLRLSKICQVLHRRRGRLSSSARRTRSLSSAESCGTLKVA